MHRGAKVSMFKLLRGLAMVNETEEFGVSMHKAQARIRLRHKNTL